MDEKGLEWKLGEGAQYYFELYCLTEELNSHPACQTAQGRRVAPKDRILSEYLTHGLIPV